MIPTWRTALPVLALGALIALSPIVTAPQAKAASSDSPTTTTDDKDKDKKEGKALRDIQELLKKSQFEPALAALVPYTAQHPDDANGWPSTITNAPSPSIPTTKAPLNTWASFTWKWARRTRPGNFWPGSKACAPRAAPKWPCSRASSTA